MKKTALFILLVSFMTTGILQAQRTINSKTKTKTTKEKTDRSLFWREKLWYGGGINLGFSQGPDLSLFNFVVSPIVGYKVTPELSLGPRIDYDYSYYKYAIGNTIQKLNTHNFGLGAFARYKFLPMIFAHLESMYYFYQSPVFNTSTATIYKIKETLPKSSVGLGYQSSAGLWGYEISLLYIFSNREYYKKSADLPIELRIGFNYNF